MGQQRGVSPNVVDRRRAHPPGQIGRPAGDVGEVDVIHDVGLPGDHRPEVAAAGPGRRHLERGGVAAMQTGLGDVHRHDGCGDDLVVLGGDHLGGAEGAPVLQLDDSVAHRLGGITLSREQDVE